MQWVSVFKFSSRWHRSVRKGPYALRPVSQQSPQGCPQNSANISLVKHRSFSTLKDRMSVASFLHSSFLQAISAVMLWPVHVKKVPQASEHLSPAKLQTRCDICWACQPLQWTEKDRRKRGKQRGGIQLPRRKPALNLNWPKGKSGPAFYVPPTVPKQVTWGEPSTAQTKLESWKSRTPKRIVSHPASKLFTHSQRTKEITLTTQLTPTRSLSPPGPQALTTSMVPLSTDWLHRFQDVKPAGTAPREACVTESPPTSCARQPRTPSVSSTSTSRAAAVRTATVPCGAAPGSSEDRTAMASRRARWTWPSVDACRCSPSIPGMQGRSLIVVLTFWTTEVAGDKLGVGWGQSSMRVGTKLGEGLDKTRWGFGQNSVRVWTKLGEGLDKAPWGFGQSSLRVWTKLLEGLGQISLRVWTKLLEGLGQISLRVWTKLLEGLDKSPWGFGQSSLRVWTKLLEGLDKAPWGFGTNLLEGLDKAPWGFGQSSLRVWDKSPWGFGQSSLRVWTKLGEGWTKLCEGLDKAPWGFGQNSVRVWTKLGEGLDKAGWGFGQSSVRVWTKLSEGLDKTRWGFGQNSVRVWTKLLEGLDKAPWGFGQSSLRVWDKSPWGFGQSSLRVWDKSPWGFGQSSLRVWTNLLEGLDKAPWGFGQSSLRVWDKSPWGFGQSSLRVWTKLGEGWTKLCEGLDKAPWGFGQNSVRVWTKLLEGLDKAGWGFGQSSLRVWTKLGEGLDKARRGFGNTRH